MSELKIWFLDVGHGDCAYIELPNGGRMMIDCGCGAGRWPSTVLKHFRITKSESPIPVPTIPAAYGIDELVITHPHGDHIADLKAIRDEIGFYLLTGSYGAFVNHLTIEEIDFKKRGKAAADVFFDVVRQYNGPYDKAKDRIVANSPMCVVAKRRFIDFTPGMDLNELSWFVSFSMGGQKVLFTGDMTAVGVRRILSSDRAAEFAAFVRGTTILKVPHHGRENGCSVEMMNLFGAKPIACIASDEMLNDRNEGTSNIGWYCDKTSDVPLIVNGNFEARKVFTTRDDKDVLVRISDAGLLTVDTRVFKELRDQTKLWS